jgi:hypothetical protein
MGRTMGAAGTFLMGVALFTGCVQQPEDAYDPALTAELTTKARALAENELRRLSEAEAAYRDMSRLHRHGQNPFMPDLGVYAKTYREYTGYELADIRRTDSLLRPYEYVVTYEFDVLSTEGRTSQSGNSPELSRRDAEFEALRKGAHTLRYRCAPTGDFAGPPPSAPAPVGYYPSQPDTSAPAPPPAAAAPDPPGDPKTPESAAELFKDL